ncbi:MAG: hypothetical protein H8E62_04650 [Planctomycetes bacterium]|nr:hypothetical protein [Planctomycetota bacterium]
MKYKSLLIALIATLLCLPVVSHGENSSSGKLTIDRVWGDPGATYGAYALVTWKNTTSKTFQCVTIQAIALDSNKQKVGMNKRSFFKHIPPGFEGTLEIPIRLNGATFKSVSCKVIEATIKR